jgi:hypothetical protein
VWYALPMTTSEETPWWADHNQLALTAAFMDRQGGSVSDIIYMLERPEKHNDDHNLAVAELDLPEELQGP